MFNHKWIKTVFVVMVIGALLVSSVLPLLLYALS